MRTHSCRKFCIPVNPKRGVSTLGTRVLQEPSLLEPTRDVRQQTREEGRKFTMVNAESPRNVEAVCAQHSYRLEDEPGLRQFTRIQDVTAIGSVKLLGDGLPSTMPVNNHIRHMLHESKRKRCGLMDAEIVAGQNTQRPPTTKLSFGLRIAPASFVHIATVGAGTSLQDRTHSASVSVIEMLHDSASVQR